MKVIFILGSGHCGSTLLDLILDSHSKVFSVGEIGDLRKQKIGTCGKELKNVFFGVKLLKIFKILVLKFTEIK
jgi:hypothetical protein